MCEVRRFRRNAEIHGLDWLSNLDCEFAGTFRRSSYQMRRGIEQSMPQIWMEWPHLLEWLVRFQGREMQRYVAYEFGRYIPPQSASL